MEEFKVLLVEDDVDTGKRLATAVRKAGFHVEVAEDGEAGLALYKNAPTEILITDLKMPGLDGLELMRAVKKISPHVQIILMTAFGETDTAVSAIREGALDYLKKPLDLNELAVALGRAKEKIAELRKREFVPALLLAEDEDGVRERLAGELEKEGWRVFPAGDGDEALHVFIKEKIDIVILDINMPKKNGLQALHEMRAMNDDFEAIILTGHGDQDSAIQALRDGAINFLKKPIDLEQMILAVEKGIEKLQIERSLKYRTRDLELATEIIGTVTMENQILVDLRSSVPLSAKEFAQELIDAMPMGLVVVNKELAIVYINKGVTNPLKYRAEKIDEEFINKLSTNV